MRTLPLLATLAACGFDPHGEAIAPDAAPAAPDAAPPITCGDLSCDPHATCTSAPTPACTCDAGYTGDGTTCTALDPCGSDNGGCAAACADMAGSADCYAPETCADVLGLVDDTSVTLYYGGSAARPWTAYCHGGVEYLTLPAGSTANFGQYTAGGKSPGTDVRTSYGRVRIDPSSLEVDVCDQTFASSTGSLEHDPNNIPNIFVTSMPLGVAMDCIDDRSGSGAGNVDVTGTPFAVDASWDKGGNNPGGSANDTDNNRVVAVTGGGSCGWDAPDGSPANPFNTFSPSSILQLSYVGE